MSCRLIAWQVVDFEVKPVNSLAMLASTYLNTARCEWHSNSKARYLDMKFTVSPIGG
ncbi:MAG: hypothetical protein JWN70_444 [Planctomycetaceae bacterium]|nr:hypothetical protein [Planctomycetaceae bacterium]